ncbi:Hypothetical predicted protein [Olea europaea subsp. europaea]|uniref:Uncharacterized protein n=1 Tax=Olea europaea subsp. europaea TaxID=158383 RepID=A0A8S0R062_OLEEU|nr:Hypothetical predicted protein [Olea europaea subsp. europaea]
MNLVWFVLLQEMREYEEFKDKDCQKLFRYKVLFGDVFNYDKYAFTPSQACRTGFAMFKDSGHEDHCDEIPIDVKSSGSSDEDSVAAPSFVTTDESSRHSEDKRKASGKRTKEKKKKFLSRDMSYSMDRATTASEKIAAKIDNFIIVAMSDPKTCISKLLATG